MSVEQVGIELVTHLAEGKRLYSPTSKFSIVFINLREKPKALRDDQKKKKERQWNLSLRPPEK